MWFDLQNSVILITLAKLLSFFPQNDLIIHEPRRRLQVKRYGEELEEEPDDASDEDYDSDDEDGKGRRGRKGKKGRGKDRDEDRPRPGSWLRTECLRLEKALLAWG